MDVSEKDVFAKIIETQNAYRKRISWNKVRSMSFFLKSKVIDLTHHKSAVDLELHRLHCLRKYLSKEAPSDRGRKPIKTNLVDGSPLKYYELYHMALKLDLVSKRKSWTRCVY